MNYSIGEVSALLNISRDMIRYYEKQGAIKIGRKSDNNYRKYDSMDVFWLLETMQHKSWGMPINEIAGIRGNDFSSNTEKFLQKEAARLEVEHRYNQMLADRLKSLGDDLILCQLNIGNYWVEKTEPEYRCHLATGRRDEYERIDLNEDASRYFFSERCMPFFECGFSADYSIDESNGAVEWEMIIRKKYTDVIAETLPEASCEIPGGICLCTYSDIGEIGAFNMQDISALIRYAAARGYSFVQSEKIRARIIGRGYEDNTMRRIIKLCIPIS